MYGPLRLNSPVCGHRTHMLRVERICTDLRASTKVLGVPPCKAFGKVRGALRTGEVHKEGRKATQRTQYSLISLQLSFQNGHLDTSQLMNILHLKRTEFSSQFNLYQKKK